MGKGEWIACLVIICFASVLDAQHLLFPYIQFTNRDGLSQLQVRHLFEDSRGYLWIGTQRGLNKYDGFQIVSFGPEYGVPDEQVLYITEDVRGHIWFSTQTYLVEFDGIRANMRRLPEPMGFPQIAAEGNRIWVQDIKTYIFENGVFKDAGDAIPFLRGVEISRLFFLPDNQPPGIITKKGEIYRIGKERLYRVAPPSGLPKPLSSYVVSGMQINCDRRAGNIGFTDRETLEQYFGGIQNDSVFLFAYNSDWWMSRIKNPLEEEAHAIIARGKGSGLYFLRDSSWVESGFPFATFRTVLRSRFGHLYAGTDQGLLKIFDGHWFIPGRDFQYPWGVTESSGGRILVSDYKAGLFGFADETARPEAYPLQKLVINRPTGERVVPEFLPGAISIPGGKNLFGGNQGINTFKGGRLGFVQLDEPIEALFWDAENRAVLAAGKKVFSLPEDPGSVPGAIPIPEYIHKKTSCTALAKDRSGNLWVSGLGGIWRLSSDKKGMEYTRQNGKLPCHGAYVLLLSGKGGLLAGGTQGLHIYDPGRDRFFPILEQSIRETVNSMVWLDSATLAVATDKALFIVREEPPGEFHIQYVFDDNNGNNLLEPAQNGMFLDSKKRLWIPAANGMQILDWGRFEKEVPDIAASSRIVLRAVNGKPLPFSADPSGLAVRQPNGILRISLDYIGAGPRYRGFRYRVNGGAWSALQPGPDFYIENLKRGKNELTIRAELELDDPARYPVLGLVVGNNYPVFLDKSFQRWGLVFLGAAVVVLLAGLWLERSKLRRIKRNVERLEVNLLQTIYSQLNPHFINNVITTIQSSLLLQTKKTSSAQLVELSKMLRYILKKEEKNELHLEPLNDEIEFLRRYLTFQQKLISNFREFSIETEEKLTAKNPYIPKMLLQPFLENALKHGISLGREEGRLWISFREKDGMMQIEIEDDGVGRDRARMLKKEKNIQSTGVGLSLVRERISLLNSMGLQIDYSIEDRQPKGTSVLLFLDLNKVHESIHR